MRLRVYRLCLPMPPVKFLPDSHTSNPCGALRRAPDRKHRAMINAAIVGLGRWGQNLVNSVQGKSDKIRFVVGVLRHPENARAYAHQHGLALRTDLASVLADPLIDAIVLASPHTVHAEQILAAIHAGKPVFTEKPFTLDSASAAEALRAAQAKKITVGVGFNWRFQPALQEIRRMLEDGRLGKLLHIEGNFCGPSVYRFPKEHWRQQREEGPAGGMTGRGVHVVDAMMYLAGPGGHGERAERPACARLRNRRHDFHAVSFQERRDGLSRNRDRDGGDVAHAGIRLERLGRSRRRRAPDDLADARVPHRSRSICTRTNGLRWSRFPRRAPSARSSKTSPTRFASGGPWLLPAATRNMASRCSRRFSSPRRADAPSLSPPDRRESICPKGRDVDIRLAPGDEIRDDATRRCAAAQSDVPMSERVVRIREVRRAADDGQ